MTGEAIDVLLSYRRDRTGTQERAWRHAVAHTRILARVEARLIEAGAVTELRQLQGMSATETDLLVRRELEAPRRASGRPQDPEGMVAA